MVEALEGKAPKKEPEQDTLSFSAPVDDAPKPEPQHNVSGIAKPSCSRCGSKKVWRAAKRQNNYCFDIQRWYCRDCGCRFSDPNDLKRAKEASKLVETVDPKSLKSKPSIVTIRQICVKETKNLGAEHQETEVLRRNGTGDNYKGKIIEYAWYLKKEGRADATILGRTKLLRVLTRRGADLYDPESLKDTIAKQPWSNGRKNNAVDAYSSFLKMIGGKWEAPLYQTVRKLPFIPKETEIDQLIAACSPRMATFLQMLKETGARCGEIWILKWADIDFESKVVNITPEKNSNPRVVHLSNKLIEMLKTCQKLTAKESSPIHICALTTTQ
jgi:hypothetical protein